MDTLSASMAESKLLLHHFYKAEHFIGTFIIVVIFLRHIVIGLKIFAPELIYPESAFVDVEMNITLFKIRGASHPNLRFWMQGFNSLPCTVTDAFAMLIGQSKENFQFIVMCFFVDFENHTTYISAIKHDAIGFVVCIIYASFDGFTGDDLAIIVNMIVTLTNSIIAPYLNAH